MVQASPAEQQRLLELQQVDTEIRRLAQRRANLPEQRALDENNDTLRRVRAEQAGARDKLQRLGAQQRRYEAEVATTDARRKSEEGRMYSGRINNERELQALREELRGLANRKNDLEDTLLEVMEQQEELDSLAVELDARSEELTGRLAALTQARDQAAGGIDGEVEARQKERDDLTVELRPELVTVYDDVRARKDGLGVSQLQGRTCSGCRLELTAIELEETRDAVRNSLARCPQCGRIIVIG